MDTSVNGVSGSCNTLSNPDVSLSGDMVSIFPNPTKADHFSIAYSGKAPIEHVKIYNLNGQMIKQVLEPLADQRYDVSELSSGIYVLEITRARKTIKRKLIKG